ncbi:MAG: glycosyltransferase [Anaerolineae bacterium]|nr:glycosyltransferase [Anaerolineae bacterium]
MEKILRQLGVDSPVEVVPNGVELKRFLDAEPLSRADFGFDAEDVLFIYVGRLGPEKNLRFLLRAFRGLSEAFDRVRLLILGSGPEREELETLASDLGLAGRVRFEGMISYDRLPAYLAMCDAFATASVTEVRRGRHRDRRRHRLPFQRGRVGLRGQDDAPGVRARTAEANGRGRPRGFDQVRHRTHHAHHAALLRGTRPRGPAASPRVEIPPPQFHGTVQSMNRNARGERKEKASCEKRAGFRGIRVIRGRKGTR